MEQQNSQDKLNAQKNLGFEQCPFYRDLDDESLEESSDLRHSHHHGCCGPNWWGNPYNAYPYSGYPYNAYPYAPFFRDDDEDINSEDDFIDQDGYRHSHHHHGCCGNGWNGYGAGFGYPNAYPYGNAPFYGNKNANENVNVNLDVDNMNFHGYRHSHHHDCEPNICLPKIPVPKMKWIKPKFYTPQCSGYPYYPNIPYGNMPYPNMGPYGNKNINENININR
jgi:hypothetical protein